MKRETRRVWCVVGCRRSKVGRLVVMMGEMERWKIVGDNWYGPDQRVDWDRILVIHRSRRSRRVGHHPPSNPIPWLHPAQQQ